ncbi:MAG: ABC transporter permease [Gallionellaceae bacterium]
MPQLPDNSNFLDILSGLWRNRRLIWQMTKRDVVGRYRGSLMGLAWSFFNPILMLVVYTFVFSVVFKSRWGGGGDESKVNFAIVLFVGMLIHGLFAECVNRAPGLILSNVNFVKKVVFPLEVLPLVAMCSTLFHTAISLAILLSAMLLLHVAIPVTLVFLPLVILPLIVGTMGLAWFLAATGVFVRDIAQTTGLVTTILMFLSPVFYPVSILPPSYQFWIYLNPLTFFIEQTRDVMIWGRMPNWAGLVIYSMVATAIAWGGLFWFQKSRKGFADVM